VRLAVEVAFTEETYPFIVPEVNGRLGVTVDVPDTATSGVCTIAITGTVASNQETWVWRVPPPVVTVLQVLEVLRYTWDFLSIDFVHNRYRSGPSFLGGFVPLRL